MSLHFLRRKIDGELRKPAADTRILVRVANIEMSHAIEDVMWRNDPISRRQ